MLRVFIHQLQQRREKMIKLTAVTGPHAGKSRIVGEEVDPFALLCEFARHDLKWQVDWNIHPEHRGVC